MALPVTGPEGIEEEPLVEVEPAPTEQPNDDPKEESDKDEPNSVPEGVDDDSLSLPEGVEDNQEPLAEAKEPILKTILVH
jgi:hypothetical protein